MNSESIVPAPTPAPTSKALPRNSFNRAFALELDKNDRIVTSASDPQYAPLLAAREISAAMVEQLKTKNDAARALLQSTVSNRTAGVGSTQSKKGARDLLEELVQEIQSAALQKFHATQPQRPAAYYIGTPLSGANEADFKMIYDGIALNLTTDTLPGITDSTRDSLRDAINEYENTDTAQGDNSGQAQDNLRALILLLDDLLARRQTIQYAADAQFSYRKSTNKGARDAFILPAKQPFRAPTKPEILTL